MSRLSVKVGTIRQLEILLALYQTGSVTAAAKALFPDTANSLNAVKKARRCGGYTTL